MTSEHHGYLINFWPATKTQVEYLKELVQSLLKQDNFGQLKKDRLQKALSHLIACSLISNSWQDHGLCPAIPVHSSLWKKMGGNVCWKLLANGGIVKVRPYSKDAGRCREFVLKEATLVEYLDRGLLDENCSRYNLISGKKTKKQFRTSIYDETRNCVFPKESQNLEALKLLQSCRCYYNLKALKNVLEEYRREAVRNPIKSNRARWHCALAAFCTVHKSPTRREERSIGSGIYSYIPVYSVTSTGRLQEKGIGLQGCPRAMKAAAFDLPGINNYDMVASQAYGMLKLANAFRSRNAYLNRIGCEGSVPKATLDVTWLKDYLTSSPSSRHAIAEEIGVSYDVWKKLFYSTIMGGTFSTFMKQIPDNTLRRKAYDALAPLRTLRSALMAHMHHYVKDVASGFNPGSLQQWGRNFFDVCLHRDGIRIKNGAGQCADAFNRQSHWNTDWKEGRLLAHILQGAEARFIAHLTAQCDDYGYKILSNQHDGLVVWGEIPKKAILAAQKTSGLGQYAILEKKAF